MANSRNSNQADPSSIEAWLTCFIESGRNKSPEEITFLIIEGKDYKRSDFTYLANGSEKTVCKIKDDEDNKNLCILIPHKYRSEEGWNDTIQKEKKLLDQIKELGLKTQEFKIVPVEIREQGKQIHTINALLAKTFSGLCEENSIAIYNRKSQSIANKIIGNAPKFIDMREHFKDKRFVQGMFKKIIIEYAIALTFHLPIGVVNLSMFNRRFDDSEHLCFELPQNSDTPPVVRYMFWDVVGDFPGVSKEPKIPRLDELKSGFDNEKPMDGLTSLANTVACAIFDINCKDGADSNDDFVFIQSLEQDIVEALNDDDFLNQALEQAKTIAGKYDVNLNPEENQEEKLEQAYSRVLHVQEEPKNISANEIILCQEDSCLVAHWLENGKRIQHFISNENTTQITIQLPGVNQSSTDSSLIKTIISLYGCGNEEERKKKEKQILESAEKNLELNLYLNKVISSIDKNILRIGSDKPMPINSEKYKGIEKIRNSLHECNTIDAINKKVQSIKLIVSGVDGHRNMIKKHLSNFTLFKGFIAMPTSTQAFTACFNEDGGLRKK